ncbi:MAG: ABC transporter permease [Alphaproteobacteria bacterium]
MIKHYLDVALRGFWRQKWMTLIKVVALAMGFASFIAAFVVSDYLSSVDGTFANSKRIYVMRTEFQWPNSTTSIPFVPYTSGRLAKLLLNENPELEAVARLTGGDHVAVKSGDEKSYRAVDYADPELLKIFNFSFISGDPLRALSEPHSAILTEQAARAIFGTTNVLGRTIRIKDTSDVTVTGVIREVRAPSMLGRSIQTKPFEILTTIPVYDEVRPADAVRTTTDDSGWFTDDFYTYVLFPKSGALTLSEFNRRLTDFGERHVPKDQGQCWFDAIPLSSLMRHIIDQGLLQNSAGLSVTTILYLFGALILAIACVDFANLATAQALARAKEIGMRKTLGASRLEIFRQSVFEVALLGFAALVLAYLAISTAVVIVNHPENLGFRAPSLLRWEVWAFLGVALSAAIIAAGAYPALVLARVRPIHALRAGTMRAGPPLLRSILVGVQFAAASFLIVAIFIMQAQNSILLSKALGSVEDSYLYIDTSLVDAKIDQDVFRSELLKHPEIRGVTAVRIPPFVDASLILDFTGTPDESGKRVPICLRGISHDYFKTLEIKILAGRAPSAARDSEIPPAPQQMTMQNPGRYVFDEATVKALGFASASQAVGKIVYMHVTGIPELGGKAMIAPIEVIGVAENRPLQFQASGSRYFGYFFFPAFSPYPVVRISKDGISAGIHDIQAVWDRLAPDTALSYQFWDDRIASSLRLFHSVANTFVGLALLAALIASLGLLGMASFTVNRRLHEIGVRKILGATSARILRLLLLDTSRPVLIANLIAWPLAFMCGQIYLARFIFRAPVTPLPFIASLALTLLLACLAVAGQAVPASRVKPAGVLRYE